LYDQSTAQYQQSGGFEKLGTAACIWLLGAVGVASAYAYWALAIAISVGTFLILNILSRLKTKVNGENPDPDHVNESDKESGQDQSSD
jgi:uncharacterized membrane protein YhiD involved in acid resistance